MMGAAFAGDARIRSARWRAKSINEEKGMRLDALGGYE
jgi:hypothetical protein